MTAWYERLSALDYSFLAFEGPTTCMHIAAVVVFETGPLASKGGGVDVARIRRHVASRLPHMPRYRQRLAYIPFENHPVWVDDERFELEYHVRHTSLPRPGTDAQLRELAARLLERPLHRGRPLWEIWVVEGLAGDRFALVMKVHHCMVDGLAGVELLSALLSPLPEAAVEEPVEWRPRLAPSASTLFSDELSRRLRMSADLLRGVRDAVREPRRRGRDIGPKLAAAWRLLRDSARRPVRTPLNQPIGPYRRFGWVEHDLAVIKEIKHQLGGTVNDVVLAVMAGAVRDFFERREFCAEGLDFRVAVPVNVRTEQERRSGGNRVSAWLLSLPIHERYSARRLQAVRAQSLQVKDSGLASGAELLAQAAEWTSANVLNLGALLANQAQPFNVIVTNVPGPQMPLYLDGAPMSALYPQVPLFESQCLGVALFSYAGKLFWGFNGDFDALPDLDQFVQAIERSFRTLRKAARPVSIPREPAQRLRPQLPSHPRHAANAG